MAWSRRADPGGEATTRAMHRPRNRVFRPQRAQSQSQRTGAGAAKASHAEPEPRERRERGAHVRTAICEREANAYCNYTPRSTRPASSPLRLPAAPASTGSCIAAAGAAQSTPIGTHTRHTHQRPPPLHPRPSPLATANAHSCAAYSKLALYSVCGYRSVFSVNVHVQKESKKKHDSPIPYICLHWFMRL